ncbi:hypothetical protein N431DRAFT_555828 [Stipitochalara longipes BDJ]|nr:hypothetical protein N431DRAFT_555828 [Stipitochalara longipes BDJ]
MATYGRREPDYFESIPEYANRDSPEPREHPSLRRASPTQKRSSPPINDEMASAADRDELRAHPGVTPELIAEITERVKKEVVEHLSKQTASEVSNKSSSTSSPPPTHTPPSPTQFSKPAYAPPPPMASPPSSPLDKPSVRFSDRRPGVARTYSTAELSTIDQKWGRLFDSEGTPTKRLGQFLRGLANHIIDDFPPRKSIVVTPTKMAAYYASHALEKEPHPLLSIFRASANEEHIQRLYQGLGCEHHLVQEDPHSEAIIPSLTPVGFAHWMTLFILAYPEEEWRRLEKVVMAMPIDADGDLVDGKPERLPKQISRHLLPEKTDANSQKLLEGAILQFLADFGSTNRRRGSLTAPSLSRRSSTQSRQRPVEIHQARTSPTSSKAQPIERERKPYAGGPSNSEGSSNEEGIKIERDRQPYTAQPGTGKVYVEKNTLNLPTRSGRANSTSSRTSTREMSDAGSRVSAREPSDIVEPREPRHQRTQSTTSQTGSGRPAARRTSSPPLRNFRHSISDDIQGGSKYGPGPSSSTSSFTPGSYGSNTSFPPPPPGPPPIDIRGERGDRRYRDDRQYNRRGTDPEEARFTGEFNSPKDAEKWDRYQEAVGSDRYNVPYERGSVSIDPREMRGAEDFYREKPRPEFDAYGRRI